MDARLQDILEPISEDSVCGEDLSFSAEFDQIQEARREDDPTIEYGDWQTTLKQADWPAVTACCIELLEKRSKDIRLASWLSEGLVKTLGLAGLADGAEITARMMERFGSDIHPLAEDANQEQRIGTLSWFVARMSQLVRQIPVTLSEAGQFSLNDYESALHLQTLMQRNAEQGVDVEDKVTLDRITAAVAKTDKSLYAGWLAETERCSAAVIRLSAISDALFDGEGPSFSPLTESLDTLHQRLQSIARDLGLRTGSKPNEVGVLNQVIPEQTARVATVSHHGPIKTRDQALDLLRQVAIFFRDTEPHSPVAYLADKAAHWGEMPLHAWLKNVVKDQGTLSHIEELLGLQAETEDGK
jgi:type VI secretion system protein ImpA